MKKDNLIGKKIEHLTVLKRVEDHITSGGNKLPQYECVCDCGRHINVLSQKLRNGRAKSCGKCGIYKDLFSIVGKKYNHLTVLRRIENYVSAGGNSFPQYECICDCGRHTNVIAAKLKNGHTKSCGKCGIYNRKKDLTGMIFDKLTVIKENGYYEYPNGDRDYKWLCKCECGNYVTVRGNSLKTNGNHDCGCYRNKLKVLDDDMIGKRFGMLKVIERANPEYSKQGFLISKWKCKCDCGNTVIAKGRELRNGKKCSCGCNFTISVGEDMVSHYLSKHDFNYKSQVTFTDLLGLNGGYLSYDFAIFIEDSIILIECQGIQHYKPIEHFGGQTQFKMQQLHDTRKKIYAKNHNIFLLELDCRLENRKNIISQLKEFLKNFELTK